MKGILEQLIPDVQIRHIVMVSVYTLIVSLQVVIVAVLIFSYFPIDVSAYAQTMFDVYYRGLRPEREISFYHLFVVFALGMQGAALYLLRKRLSDGDLGKKISDLIFVDGLLLLAALFAGFKIFLYGNPLWARVILYASIGLFLLVKIFWPELNRWIVYMLAGLPRTSRLKWLRATWAIGICVLIAAMINVADVELIKDSILIWGNLDQFHLWRMGQGWGLEHLDDIQFFHLMTIAVVVYFWIFFGLMCVWLRSLLLASTAVLLAIKWQLFHLATVPIIWQYPQKFQVGYVFDLLLFFLLWSSIQLKRKPLIAITLGMIGLESLKVLWRSFTADTHIPLVAPLAGRYFFTFIWQFTVPVLYLVSLLWIGLKDKSKAQDLMLTAVCVYGLAVFSLHVRESTPDNFYTVSFPLVMVLAFWVKEFLDRSKAQALNIKMVLVFLMLGALMTNNMFMVYPNIFNVAGVSWGQVKAFAQQNQKNMAK